MKGGSRCFTLLPCVGTRARWMRRSAFSEAENVTRGQGTCHIVEGVIDFRLISMPYENGETMRKPRISCEGDVYHVMGRGVGLQLIFEDDTDREFFLRVLHEESSSAGAQVFAWCLMGNHFHLILQAPMESVSSLMRCLCSRYAYVFNVRHERKGHLFQERFKSEPIDSDAYLLTAVRYVHENPQKAGLAEMDIYPWSSYREYTVGSCLPFSICTREFVLACFGGLEGFLSFHGAPESGSTLTDIGEVRTRTTAMSDRAAVLIAESVLREVQLSDLKAMPREARDAAISDLLDAGLSIRQIARLTGIGRGIIQRAKR